MHMESTLAEGSFGASTVSTTCGLCQNIISCAGHTFDRSLMNIWIGLLIVWWLIFFSLNIGRVSFLGCMSYWAPPCLLLVISVTVERAMLFSQLINQSIIIKVSTPIFVGFLWALLFYYVVCYSIYFIYFTCGTWWMNC